MRNSRGDYRKGKAYILLAIAVLAMALAAFVRFYRLQEFGLYDDDASSYTGIAKKWFFDHYFMNPYAKPGYHALGALAIVLAGYYDFTLLYLNSFMDMINILLIFLIGRKIGIRPILCLSASGAYAFLPCILKEASRGLPHLSSTTFYLGAFYVFLFYLDSKFRNKACLFLCGLFSIFAGQIHPTLLCSALFYFIILIGLSAQRPFSRVSCLRLVKDLAVYTLGGIFVYVVLALLLARPSFHIIEGFRQMITRLLSHREGAIQGHQGYIFIQLWYALRDLPKLMTAPYVIFFSAITGWGLFIGVRFLRRPFCLRAIGSALAASLFDKKLLGLWLLWGNAGFFLLVNLLTARAWLPRLTIPAVPLIILGSAVVGDILASRYPKLKIGGLFSFVVLGVSFFNIMSNIVLIQKTPTVYRQMANVLYHKVDALNRMLIVPSQLYQACVEAVYFKGEYIYRVKGPWEPEREELERYNIRYIVIAKDINRDDLDPEEEKLMQAEVVLTARGLTRMGAACIYESDKLAVMEIAIEPTLGELYRPPLDCPFWRLEHFYQRTRIKGLSPSQAVYGP